MIILQTLQSCHTLPQALLKLLYTIKQTKLRNFLNILWLDVSGIILFQITRKWSKFPFASIFKCAQWNFPLRTDFCLAYAGFLNLPRKLVKAPDGVEWLLSLGSCFVFSRGTSPLPHWWLIYKKSLPCFLLCLPYIFTSLQALEHPLKVSQKVLQLSKGSWK